MRSRRRLWEFFASAALLLSSGAAASDLAAPEPTGSPAEAGNVLENNQDEPKKEEPKKEEPKKEPEKTPEAQAEKKPESDEKKDEKPEAPKRPPVRTPTLPPLGTAGPSRGNRRPPPGDDHFVPAPDRWRAGFPEWERYPGGLGAPYRRGSWLNPYRQNILKGDYPIWGQNTFLNLTLANEFASEFRRRPTPSNVSAARPGAFEFFGSGRQVAIDETFLFTLELFHGDTSYKPRDWVFRFTPALNLNYLDVRETGVVNIDVRNGTSRLNTDIGIQELFGEYKLKDLGPRYDFISARAGIQGFTSDFRGFLFSDSEPGVRFFGTSANNRNQYNLAYFHNLEKETYSRLNTIFGDRGQDVVIANIYRQDLFRPGYTGQFSFAYNNDHGGRHFDANDRQVRPVLLGAAKPHEVRAWYLGLNGEGHFGRWNVTHAFYQAFGRDTLNPIARKSTDINAQFAAVELSYDRDWLRMRGAFLYASGDSKPKDGRARGFDAIFDNPAFAGGGFSFWQSQGIPLTGTAVELVSEGSFLPTLRSSKLEGQANFVNPGLLLVNLGADAELTPKWRVSGNVNWIQFEKTQPLELVLNQAGIGRGAGLDYSIGFRHRPFLNDNAVLIFGASAFFPGRGFQDIFENKTLFSGFVRLNLTF